MEESAGLFEQGAVWKARRSWWRQMHASPSFKIRYQGPARCTATYGYYNLRNSFLRIWCRVHRHIWSSECQFQGGNEVARTYLNPQAPTISSHELAYFHARHLNWEDKEPGHPGSATARISDDDAPPRSPHLHLHLHPHQQLQHWKSILWDGI